MTLSGEVKLFQRRQAETMVWCNLRASIADPVGSLRTHALRPRTSLEAVPIRDRRSFVEILGDARAAMLQEARIPIPSRVPLKSDGRVLYYQYESSTRDTGAPHFSKGFFNLDDAPPWDSWIYYNAEPGHSFLLSWVPCALIEIANQGLLSNSDQCICWASKIDTEFTRLLKSNGLLS